MIFDLTDGKINGKSKQIWEAFMDQENQTPHKRRVRYKGKYPKKFEEKYQLPFILLANPELDVLQAYDVWKEKNMYGRMVMGVVRTTYLINEEGIIEKAFTKVKAADDAERMLREIESE